jgi:hypothetical protein
MMVERHGTIVLERHVDHVRFEGPDEFAQYHGAFAASLVVVAVPLVWYLVGGGVAGGALALAAWLSSVSRYIGFELVMPRDATKTCVYRRRLFMVPISRVRLPSPTHLSVSTIGTDDEGDPGLWPVREFAGIQYSSSGRSVTLFIGSHVDAVATSSLLRAEIDRIAKSESGHEVESGQR